MSLVASILEGYDKFKEFYRRNLPFVESLIGSLSIGFGGWLNAQGGWMKDFAYGKEVGWPLINTDLTVPGNLWYIGGIISDMVGIGLISYGAYNIGKASYIGLKTYRQRIRSKEVVELHKKYRNKEIDLKKLLDDLDELKSNFTKLKDFPRLEALLRSLGTAGLAAYVAGDIAIAMAWYQNYYHNIDDFFGLTYGQFWNNILYFIMLPSFALIMLGSFVKGVKAGREFDYLF